MAAEQRLTPTERANLVAYLDGELNEAESRVIATKLTQSPTARREVESLERTWELLEYLPRAHASENFTARTLSGVQALGLKGQQLTSAARSAAHRATWAAVWVLASCAAFLLGFALLAWVWPDPTARLARDLPIAEHYQEYRDVGSWEFLEALASSPEFGADRD
jgi:anti-sigma factor RsiW